jgi:dipeptidyl aminopeptidase/acylaminoacyl peptidase
MKENRLVVFLILFLAVSCAHAQKRFADFPFTDQMTTSPDGRFALVNKGCEAGPKAQCDRKLWLVDRRTKTRKLLLEIERNVHIGWAPRGRVFFLNDNLGSNESEAYIYFSGAGPRLDLGKLIDQQFPVADDWKRGHHYFNGVRWISAQTLLVKRFGHTDENPSKAFTICYLVNTTGHVTRLSETDEEDSPCKLP